MSIESRKISLAQRLFAVQKESILDKIEALLAKESSLTSEQKEAIDKGLYSLNNEDRLTHTQVVNETKNRYPNL